MQRLYADKREPHRRRIEAQMARADSDDFRRWCRVRLDWLNELSMGGKPPAGKKTKVVTTARRVETPPEKLTPQEQEYANAVAKRLNRRAVAA